MLVYERVISRSASTLPTTWSAGCPWAASLAAASASSAPGSAARSRCPGPGATARQSRTHGTRGGQNLEKWRKRAKILEKIMDSWWFISGLDQEMWVEGRVF